MASQGEPDDEPLLAGAAGAPVVERFAASFRDPSSYVFRKGGRIYRAIDGPTDEALRALERSGLLRRIIDEELFVPTRFIDSEEERAVLAAEIPGHDRFLEHEPVPIISYPYEWPVSMLADAGVLTLDLQLRILESGVALKDASAFNVQFVGGRPRFIDAGSIEVPARRDAWHALGQFHRMFTYPLLLCLDRGWDPRSYFLGAQDGRDALAVARAYGGSRWLRPGLLLDLTLPAWLTSVATRRGGSGSPPKPRAATSSDIQAQAMNLRRLRSKVARLGKAYRPGGAWSRYPSTCPYGADAEESKKGIVAGFLERVKPQTVLDLGCNTGDFSLIAAAAGARVLAVDADHDTIELFYRRLRNSPADILPLVVDLSNPSPKLGYCNLERDSFLERAGADCVLALALIHHLLVTANFTPVMIRDLLASLSFRWLILEFVPREDPMFRELLRFRHESFEWLTLDSFRAVFLELFEVVAEESVIASERTLLLLRKRVDGNASH